MTGAAFPEAEPAVVRSSGVLHEDIGQRCPTPSSRTAATMFVRASHWWNRGKSMLVRRTDVPVVRSHSSLVSTIISRPMMPSQAFFSQTRSHRYAVADRALS